MFFGNVLFLDEEYLSDIYHLEKDIFFTLAEGFFENLFMNCLLELLLII